MGMPMDSCRSKSVVVNRSGWAGPWNTANLVVVSTI